MDLQLHMESSGNEPFRSSLRASASRISGAAAFVLLIDSFGAYFAQQLLQDDSPEVAVTHE